MSMLTERAELYGIPTTGHVHVFDLLLMLPCPASDATGFDQAGTISVMLKNG